MKKQTITTDDMYFGDCLEIRKSLLNVLDEKDPSLDQIIKVFAAILTESVAICATKECDNHELLPELLPELLKETLRRFSKYYTIAARTGKELYDQKN